MMYRLKQIIKLLSPKFIFSFYHWIFAKLTAWFYGNPSEKMIIVGVTGTNGKSSTVVLIAEMLKQMGLKSGYASTVSFGIGDETWFNKKKMTMLGRGQIQQFLRRMLDAGCTHAVIEVSSEGINQYRHKGINFDVCVFTNLTPEHIESHGSFEKYKAAKLKLFAHLSKSKEKFIMINDRIRFIENVIVANIGAKYANEFLHHKVNKKYGVFVNGYGDESEKITCMNKIQDLEIIETTDLKITDQGTHFVYSATDYFTKLLGGFNVENIVTAMTVAKHFGATPYDLKKIVSNLEPVPGRMEFVHGKQNFTTIVDYAPEPYSLAKSYETLKLFRKEGKKLIHVFGSCGGGRDVARQPILGEMAAQEADILIITNEDPYDDNPMAIIENVESGALNYFSEKNIQKPIYKILDRKEAIEKAVSLAKEGDIVLITGKGAEQFMCVANGEMIPWDDREILKEILENKK